MCHRWVRDSPWYQERSKCILHAGDRSCLVRYKTDLDRTIDVPRGLCNDRRFSPSMKGARKCGPASLKFKHDPPQVERKRLTFANPGPALTAQPTLPACFVTARLRQPPIAGGGNRANNSTGLTGDYRQACNIGAGGAIYSCVGSCGQSQQYTRENSEEEDAQSDGHVFLAVCVTAFAPWRCHEAGQQEQATV